MGKSTKWLNGWEREWHNRLNITLAIEVLIAAGLVGFLLGVLGVGQ